MNGSELTLWDRFKIAITPKSHAEALVDEMYSTEHRGMAGLPGFPAVQEYEPESAAAPQIFVDTQRAVVAPFKQAAAAISDASGAVSGTLKKYAIIGFIGIALLVVLYAGTSAFIGRR